MANPAPRLPLPETAESPNSLPPGLPILLNARDLAPLGGAVGLPASADLRFIDPSTPAAPSKPGGGLSKKESRQAGNAVLRGIKDLQQLQKQTIAVLESVKGSLDDIAQVLRSPEATRGMEKQQNAATLLSKGFHREAVEQAAGAVALLPANPDSHLLLALSLAADQQFDAALLTARKGLALIDRRTHPLAIECGLLHALAALGCHAEALDRWSAIIDALPLPVLFEQLPRIAACFPTDGLGGGSIMLDDFVNRRLAREEQKTAENLQIPQNSPNKRERLGKIDLLPSEIPAGALFAGLDAAKDFALTLSHRAILAQIARRLQLVKDPGDVLRFLTECLVPLGNRGLDRSVSALGLAAAHRLLKFHADAMTLHRAMTKLEQAGAVVPMQELAILLNHWRREGAKVARNQRILALSGLLIAAGAGLTAFALLKSPILQLAGRPLNFLWIGPVAILTAFFTGVVALMGRTWHVSLPENRGPLTPEEHAFLATRDMRQSLRAALLAK